MVKGILDSLWPDELETSVGVYHRFGGRGTFAEKRIPGDGSRILHSQIRGRAMLTDPESISLAEIAKRLGCKTLEEVAQIVRAYPGS